MDKKNLQETDSVGAFNNMGPSSSSLGSGSIAMYDPLLKVERKKKKLRTIVPIIKRKAPYG